MNRNNGKKRFKENLFEFFSLSLDHQVSGKAKVTIVWIFSIAELLAYTFNSVYKSGIVASPSVNMIAQFLKYAELEQLKSVSTFLYTTISTTLKILILANHSMFLIFVVDKLKFLRMKKLTQIYCSYNFYKAFILVIPFSEIVMKDLIDCTRANLDSIMLIFNIIVLSFLVLGMLKQTFFLQFDFFSKDNYLVSFDSHFYIKMISVKFLICFLLFFGFRISNRTVNLVSLVLLWLAALIPYLYLSFCLIFEKLSLQKVINCLIGIYFALVTSLALSSISSNFHFLYGFLLMSLFSMIIQHFLQPNTIKLYSNDMLQNHRNLLQFVQNYLNTTKKYEPNSKTSITLKGFFNFHIMKCLSPSCFCGKSSFYISSKNVYIGANKNEKVSLFTKYLIKEKLEHICLLNPTSQFHKYVLAVFIYTKLKNKIQAMNIIKTVSGEACSFSNQFKFYRLCRAISKDQDENNKDKLREKKFEELLRFEDASNHFIRLVSDLFIGLNNFWNFMLNNSTVCPNIFAKETSKILKIKKECKALLKVMESFNNYSDRLKFLHGFVKRELLNVKIVDKLDELFLNLEDEEPPAFSADLTILNANFYNTFLHNTSCVFEIGMHPLTVGIIQRVSESVYNVFGHQKTEIIGKSINQLMPEPIAKSHDQILLDVYQKGILLSKTNSMLSWAITKTSCPIEVKIKYRIDLTRDANVVLTGVAVKVESQAEPNYFIITDDLGFIISLSDVLIEGLGIKKSDIKERRINIGMLSPQLLMQLPVHILFQKIPKGSSGENFYIKSRKTGEHSLPLTLVVDEQDLEKLIKIYESLKSLNNQVLEDFKNGNCGIEYIATTNSYKITNINQNEDINESLHVSNAYSSVSFARIDSVKRKSVDYRKHFQMFFDESKTYYPRKDKSIDGHLIQSIANHNYLTVTMDMEARRHSRISNLNVFVVKKLNCKIEPRSVRNNYNNKSMHKQSNGYLELSHGKEGLLINSSYKHETMEQSSIYEKSQVSIRSDSKFLPYIKQTLNYFYKENNEIPHSKYPKLLKLNLMAFIVLISIVLFELIFLIFSKISILTSMKQTSMEYYEIIKFERDIINTYSYLISNTLNNTSINSTSILLNRIKKAQDMAHSDSVIKYIFSQDINFEFMHVFTPGVELNMNHAFLVQNYLYEINKYLIGVKKPTDFNQEAHSLFMTKYKTKLSDFLKKVKELFSLEFEKNQNRIKYYFMLIFAVGEALVVLSLFVIMIYMNVVLMKIFAINDTILHTDDSTINFVINYYSMAHKFFNDHFNSNDGSPSQKATERSTIRSNLLIREKKKNWQSQKKNVRKNMVIFNLVSILAIGIWAAIYVGRYYFELSLYTVVDESQKIAGFVQNDASSIAKLIMFAKEFYMRKDSLKIIDSEILYSLNSAFDPMVIPGKEGNAIEIMIKDYYAQNICSYINSTELTINSTCGTIYNSLLQNNINTIKNLLKSKLGFVFTQSNELSYNYTQHNIPELDDVNIFVENSICVILRQWKKNFENLITQNVFYFILLAIAGIVISALGYTIYMFIVANKLMLLYKHERAVFMNFMPGETLKKTKLAQVHLARDEILKRK